MMEEIIKRIDFDNLHIESPDKAICNQVKANWDALAKPLDSMGVFETVLSQIGAILGDTSVDIGKKAVIVMCADNGIVEENISQSSQEVTEKVAIALGNGTSSVCRMARAAGVDVVAVDLGINCDEPIPGVIDKKIKRGTCNFLKEKAMTADEALTAITTGANLVRDLKEKGYRLIATGEMGIGNTTTSSAVAVALLKCPAADITGKGAGLSDVSLAHKIDVIEQGLSLHQLENASAFETLCAVGGLDIAGLVGVFIGGSLYHIPIIVDGVISAVAALLAERMLPGVKEYCIASHKSKEPAAGRILDELQLTPVIDANLALGEGTGAVLMCSLLDTARALYDGKTDFADMQLEPYQRF